MYAKYEKGKATRRSARALTRACYLGRRPSQLARTEWPGSSRARPEGWLALLAEWQGRGGGAQAQAQAEAPESAGGGTPRLAIGLSGSATGADLAAVDIGGQGRHIAAGTPVPLAVPGWNERGNAVRRVQSRHHPSSSHTLSRATTSLLRSSSSRRLDLTCAVDSLHCSGRIAIASLQSSSVSSS